MMYAFIRWWAKVFLRLYFRKTIIYGRENVPLQGPLILASNHPSAFMEASILSTIMPRDIHFLVRGDMFHPKFRWLFEWTKQIPIYRQKDGISNLRKNASSFDLTHKKLSEGEAVLIFPEAKTVLEKKMRPIQRGTAHLAFGTMPLIKSDAPLMVQPVGVNFLDPRIPGTDVVVTFGKPFSTPAAGREDREAIEQFTDSLSRIMSPLIIQVEDDLEKNYDVMASVYFRMIYDNFPSRDAHSDLQNIAAKLTKDEANEMLVKETSEVIRLCDRHRAANGIYFPDMIMLSRMGLMMMLLLKLVWLIAGGWIWRLVRNMIYSKIKTPTFQGPTTLGIFMVVMPLVWIILGLVTWIAGWPWYIPFAWLLLMFLGTLIRPPLELIWHLLIMPGHARSDLKTHLVVLRRNTETLLSGDPDESR